MITALLLFYTFNGMFRHNVVKVRERMWHRNVFPTLRASTFMYCVAYEHNPRSISFPQGNREKSLGIQNRDISALPHGFMSSRLSSLRNAGTGLNSFSFPAALCPHITAARASDPVTPSKNSSCPLPRE